MRTTELEVYLMRYFNYTQKLIVCNVTRLSGLTGFETDMVVLSKSGYAHGLELKVSKSDLRAEFSKRQYGNHKFSSHLGYSELMKKYYGRFKYFSFAVPYELKELSLKLVPSKFGIICVGKESVSIVRDPSVLFKYKWGNDERFDLARLGAMRQYTLKKNILKLK